MTIWALVPLKHPDQAKTRLAPVLDAARRRALFFLMARQVIGACRRAASLTGVAVVTPSGEAAHFAEDLGARIIADEPARGTNEACAAALDRLAREQVRRVLILPGDLPFIEAADVETLNRDPQASPRVALVGDRQRQGTNALLLDPPNAIAPAFGPDSFARHALAARRAGVPLDLPDLPALGLDIDNESDYALMKGLLQGTETAAWFSERAQRLNPALQAFCLN